MQVVQAAHRLAYEMILNKSAAALMWNKVCVRADLSDGKTKDSTRPEPGVNIQVYMRFGLQPTGPDS